MKLKFEKSVAVYKQCPPPNRPEILIVGRSNAGKSSLINCWARAKVAYVSSMPGRTTLLNFYTGKGFRLVDSPGYGFARGGVKPGDEAVEHYLNLRASLRGILLLMDMRRDWSSQEEQIANMAASRGLPWALVLTKCDKLNRRDYDKQLRDLRRNSGAEHVFPVSSLKKTGVDDLIKFVFEYWVEPREDGNE